jgi:hypothetical protein
MAIFGILFCRIGGSNKWEEAAFFCDTGITLPTKGAISGLPSQRMRRSY